MPKAKTKVLSDAQEKRARELYVLTQLDIRSIRAYLRGEPVMRATRTLIEQHTK